MGEGSPGSRAVDTHTHLNHPRLLRRLEEVVARARDAGVGDMIVVGYDLSSSEEAVTLAGMHDGLWAAVGIHPHDAAELDDAAVRRLKGLAQRERVVAIGETGLDFYRDLAPRDVQRRAFERQLSLADELALPVIVHCREAQDVVLEILRSSALPRVVWHCFDGSPGEAARALALGVWLGFGGRLTHRRAGDLQRAAKEAPGDRILLETDCPYLAPEPRRGRDNEPANVRVVADCLARVRGESAEQIVRQTTENARQLFGLGCGHP
jgi:TatD DNase family protein